MKSRLHSVVILFLTIIVLLLASSRLPADTSTCGGTMITVPFTDVMNNIFFCQIAEAFLSGLTNGTTSTTYSPSDVVLRDQMAAFVTRTQDSALRRGSRRAALGQWATPSKLPSQFGIWEKSLTTVGINPFLVASDGEDLWVANNTAGTISRVHASDGKVLTTFLGATAAFGVLVARGIIWVTAAKSPGDVYAFDPNSGGLDRPSPAPGDIPEGIATDGTWVWTANTSGSVSRIDPDSFSLTNFNTVSSPRGVLFDGLSIWVTDVGDNKLKRLDSNGNVTQNVPVGGAPGFPVFDGSNIWVPNNTDNSVTVVRARDGMVLVTLLGNGLNGPIQAAFDGQRILVTNFSGNSLSLWKAADMTQIGNIPPANGQDNRAPYGACSDGINFWITLLNSNQLLRL
jgi:hypothetical protein